ncbi:MAG: Gfo/Idh/MocA family oxidoreductase [Bryobacteraceae bacterium]
MSETPRRIRTALIGCGKVGLTHAAVWQRLPRSKFVAVCDVSHDRAKRFAQCYGVNAYTDAKSMFERESVEVVSIATPHPLHAAAIQAAAAAGVHALCEKPLAPSLTACDGALEATRKAGVSLGVVSQRRFYECIQRMKSAIDEGKIGKPVLATVTLLGWRDEAYYQSDPWRGTWAGEGGGVMVNQAIHHLDLLLYLMGPVAELFGYHDNFNHPTIEVEDTAAALVRFANKAIGCIVLSNSQRPGLYGKIHIHGASGASIGAQVEAGSAFISGVTEKAEPPANDLWTVPGEEHLLERWQEEDSRRDVDVMSYYHEQQFDDFLTAMLEGRAPKVTGDDGRAAVELFTAVYLSQQHSSPMRFPLVQSAYSEVSHAYGN